MQFTEMQTEEYKEQLKEVLENLHSINGIILNCLVGVSMTGEYKEWSDATAIGTVVNFDFEFFKDVDDMNIQMLLELKQKVDETFQRIENLNGIELYEE